MESCTSFKPDPVPKPIVMRIWLLIVIVCASSYVYCYDTLEEGVDLQTFHKGRVLSLWSPYQGVSVALTEDESGVYKVYAIQGDGRELLMKAFSADESTDLRRMTLRFEYMDR